MKYECIGNGEKTVVVLGGISATRHVAANEFDPSPGWWEAQVGSGRAIDTDAYTVVGIDYLGAELQPGDDIPAVSTHDQARALAVTLDSLEIPCISAIVGSSYGGMVALAFGSLFPERVEKLIVIGAAHAPYAMATALRSIERKIVQLAQQKGCPEEGLNLARQLAMTTYRSGAEFETRFSSREQLEQYLEYCGSRYAKTFTAERFLCLSESIDSHRIDPAAVLVPVTLIGIDSDAIAPPSQIRSLADRLPARAKLIELTSIYGHDAFLKEIDAIAAVLRNELELEVCV